MFAHVFTFELRYHTRQYLFYILSGIFFLLMFLSTTTPNVQMVGGVDNLNINAAYTVVLTLASLSFLILFGGIAFCANAVIRDSELNTAEMFLSTPVRKFDYVYGRFLGTLVLVVALYMAGLAGVLLGELMPWLDAQRLGPMNLHAYWFATWAFALPTIFVFCSIFFCIATVTRSMMATYVGMVVLLMLSFLLDTFTDKDTIRLTSILDPFGQTALELFTRYWTVFQKNQDVPTLTGALLTNRALWMGVGTLFFVAVYPLTTLSIEHRSRRRRKRAVLEDVVAPSSVATGKPVVHAAFGTRAQVVAFLSQTRLEIRNIVFSVPFLILLFLGLFLVVANSIASLGDIFGTPVYPTTPMMIDVINGAFSLSLVSVLVYYAGELLAREKALHVNGIMDAMPWPNWVMLAAKLTGLGLVIVAMLFAAAIAGVGVQLYKGFFDIDVVEYVAGLLFFFQFPLYLMMSISLFAYVVTRNKYASMFIMVLYVLYSIAMPRLGLENYLYRLREVSPVYSDFTGYSQNLEPYLWQTLYYFFFGGLLLVAAHLLWPRGIEDDWASRIRVMRQRMTLPVVVTLWGLSTALVLTGGYIYYNIKVLNNYVTEHDTEAAQANYEKKYKRYQYLPLPTVQKVYADVDIYPHRRDVHIKGHYVIGNETNGPLKELHVSYSPLVKLDEFSLQGATLLNDDSELGYRIYRLDKPMQPGDVRDVDFDVQWTTPGFANGGHSLKVTSNGTFFNNLDAFPMLGYRSDFELKDNNKRRDHGLPPLKRMDKIDDKAAWNRVGLGSSHRVDFETVVSTSADQVAIAPGYLLKEWTEGDRRYFHYKMDQPIWDFFAYVSADYKVKRDHWHDVSIEVYYLHDYNVDTMIRAAKNSLDYYTTHFSPYQYRQFRILEFPRFQGRFAQSFPNTIPFSESIGFVADLRDPEKIDYVYYVTAHELAHQWWAHQVLGADVQGSTMIVESLAQYSALMVMEHEYGADHMKRFLQYELDRYLSGRGGELIEELPLYLVEDQPYIHYRKGSVVLYALKDYIGEDNMDRALAKFLGQYAFKGPPYPTTKDLIADIRDVAPPRYQDVITDLLQKIVLFDLRVTGSHVEALPDGKYRVTIDVAARKYEADGGGKESEVPMNAWLDIGVFGEKQGKDKVPEVLYMKKYDVDKGQQSFTVTVDKKPVSVGVDPFNKMIDRDPSDNVARVGES